VFLVVKRWSESTGAASLSKGLSESKEMRKKRFIRDFANYESRNRELVFVFPDNFLNFAFYHQDGLARIGTWPGYSLFYSQQWIESKILILNFISKLEEDSRKFFFCFFSFFFSLFFLLRRNEHSRESSQSDIYLRKFHFILRQRERRKREDLRNVFFSSTRLPLTSLVCARARARNRRKRIMF